MHQSDEIAPDDCLHARAYIFSRYGHIDENGEWVYNNTGGWRCRDCGLLMIKVKEIGS